MISLSGITKTFPQRKGEEPYKAIDNVTLTINKGEFVSLLGPSGCGKSTLLNMIAGFDKPTKGKVEVNSIQVSEPGPDRVVVFQDHALFPWLTVLDNVAFGLSKKGMNKKKRMETAMEYIRLVHLSKFADRYPHELSGGMKQRAALARALAMEPDILLMDEPFAALDEQTRLILHRELEELWMKTGKTILFITHNIREAVMLSDRVLVMETQPGRIKEEFRVPALRPHNSSDPLIHEVEDKIMVALEDELEKVVREELGDEYRFKKNRIFGAAGGDMGAGI